MEDFRSYLDKIGEVGFTEQAFHSIAYVSGLPGLHSQELVVFEDGNVGQAFSVDKEHAEILLFGNTKVQVGGKVARTDEILKVPVGDSLLGRLVDPLGRVLDGGAALTGTVDVPVDKPPPKIMERRKIDKPLETGVTIVDTVIPMAKGQRELVIGDLKIGKREFLLQTAQTQAKQGTVIIYAMIGQKKVDILKVAEFFQKENIKQKTIIVASNSLDSPGLMYLTPYSAMTMAEYFRDKGMDVMLVLDNLTTHASVYREISLLARRFPGRASYPGDVFYVHARLLERAGSFKKGSITCFPVARSIFRDFSGYIQTNLMSMTDGHIFFDIDLYNEGKRPAISPFISVTRVGRQTQTSLLRDIGRELTRFLVEYERMKQFMHFGAEAGQAVKDALSMGAKIDVFFNQTGYVTVPINVNIIILAGIWGGIWNAIQPTDLKTEFGRITAGYGANTAFRKKIDDTILSTKGFSDLVTLVKRQTDIYKI